jgi:hypothetical protein
MLALIALLNREYIRINVLKALASIICKCNLHVILLSSNTLRYFTLFRNGIFRLFSLRREDRPSLILIDFNILAFTPGRHRVEPTLDLSQNIALLAVCRI